MVCEFMTCPPRKILLYLQDTQVLLTEGIDKFLLVKQTSLISCVAQADGFPIHDTSSSSKPD